MRNFKLSEETGMTKRDAYDLIRYAIGAGDLQAAIMVLSDDEHDLDTGLCDKILDWIVEQITDEEEPNE